METRPEIRIFNSLFGLEERNVKKFNLFTMQKGFEDLATLPLYNHSCLGSMGLKQYQQICFRTIQH